MPYTVPLHFLLWALPFAHIPTEQPTTYLSGQYINGFHAAEISTIYRGAGLSFGQEQFERYGSWHIESTAHIPLSNSWKTTAGFKFQRFQNGATHHNTLSVQASGHYETASHYTTLFASIGQDLSGHWSIAHNYRLNEEWWLCAIWESEHQTLSYGAAYKSDKIQLRALSHNGSFSLGAAIPIRQFCMSLSITSNAILPPAQFYWTP